MLCRTSKLVHPISEQSIQTPLLIPSFSSKIFSFVKNGQSDLYIFFDISKEFITKTCLISAYDIFYNYLPKPEDLGITVDLLFLDSGGFEVLKDYEFQKLNNNQQQRTWNINKLDSILLKWPETIPAVFISFDHPEDRCPIQEQILKAKQIFSKYPNQLHLFLLKPQKKIEITLEQALKKLFKQIDCLKEFQIIGVTEKELGLSIFERMVNIAKLRKSLDNAGLFIPIHIFGTLNPLSVILYFLSGAEIFDGLTWIQYAYYNNQCIYLQDNAILKYDLNINNDELRIHTIINNIRLLEKLERSLYYFAKTMDWKILGSFCELAKSVSSKVETEIGRFK